MQDRKANSANSDTSEFSRMIDAALSRRQFIKGSMSAGIAGFFATNPLSQAMAAKSPKLNFEPVAATTADTITLPAGYQWDVVVRWGDPLFKDAPSFDPSGKATGTSQTLQFGDNTDGMSLFPLGENRAILAINNEYTNYDLLFHHGGKDLTKDDVLKAQHAHGVSVVEVEKQGGQWKPVVDSRFNRRIHVNSEMEMTGPAAGHRHLKTDADPTGKKVMGTFNNCANGETPWGTYLTCEENFHGYFGTESDHKETADELRYGVKTRNKHYNWHLHDARFDFAKNPNEPHRHGWVVEIDPMDPTSRPKKRTALGRFKHENAALYVNQDGHVVVYLGDDERGEHLYKFISKGKYNPNNQGANRNLLEEGTLYVARFSMNPGQLAGSGEWLELTHGKNGLTKANGFADQAEVLIFTRRAATQVGATTMDRPEWVAIHPSGKQVYCTLTNNKHRGVKEGQPVGGPNPRKANHYGQIVRWQPAKGDHTSHTFSWDLFVLAGNPVVHRDLYGGSNNIDADNMFNSPDGIGFDAAGTLWIQTDGNYSNEGDFIGMGNNQMLAANPETGEIKRFMVGPKGCEVTGLAFSPDMKSMFVGIQHPGEKSTGSHWPDGGNSKPRSTVIVISKQDGGLINS